MEAQGIVKGLDGNFALVEITEKQGGCGRCNQPGGCATGLLSHGAGASCRRFRLANAIDARPGDRVRLEVPEGAPLKAALLAYGLPLACLFLGTLLPGILSDGGVPEWGAVAGGVAGLLAGWGLLKALQQGGKLRQNMTPVLVRID